MTLSEIRKSDIAEIVGSDPQSIRDEAKNCPERLGFPITRIGSRTKIPRLAFLKWLGEDVE